MDLLAFMSSDSCLNFHDPSLSWQSHAAVACRENSSIAVIGPEITRKEVKL